MLHFRVSWISHWWMKIAASLWIEFRPAFCKPIFVTAFALTKDGQKKFFVRLSEGKDAMDYDYLEFHVFLLLLQPLVTFFFLFPHVSLHAQHWKVIGPKYVREFHKNISLSCFIFKPLITPPLLFFVQLFSHLLLLLECVIHMITHWRMHSKYV